jgi:hypothetical protein
MSLLDKVSQPIRVYPEVTVLDPDGNKILRPATEAEAYDAVAELQPQRQSGTSARRAEQDDEGYFTEETYRLRFSRAHDRTHPPLGQGAEILWNGDRWSVVGMPTKYMGSPRTRHIDYQVRRS